MKQAYYKYTHILSPGNFYHRAYSWIFCWLLRRNWADSSIESLSSESIKVWLFNSSRSYNLRLGSTWSICMRTFWKLLQMRPCLNSFFVWGWNLKKSVFPGFIWRYLKYVSDAWAVWNGGAPKARMKNRTPREKMSEILALQG